MKDTTTDHFREYSRYYDIVYQDKDYAGEAAYIDGLIRDYKPDASALIEFGCGTGRHAEYLAQKGYRIHGIDNSDDMIDIAMKRRQDNLVFSKADVRSVDLKTRCDVVFSIFHVASYQTTNSDLSGFIESAGRHLDQGGIFLFDFWYGPGVLSDPPVVRVKRMEDEKLRILRIAEPVLHPNENIVDVNYDIYINEKGDRRTSNIKELHRMRYLFLPELNFMLAHFGFRIVDAYRWMTREPLDIAVWYGLVVCEKA